MIILGCKTDQPEALLLLRSERDDSRVQWPAHRVLSDTIYQKLDELLQGADLSLKDIEGIVLFKGPGSFTGLRIGFSAMNGLADALGVPVVATAGEDWFEAGCMRITHGETDGIAVPDYGGPAHTTRPRK